jgi:hypothetical protein
VIAEGISMALQSAWLLAGRLAQWRDAGLAAKHRAAVMRAYAADWRRHFAPRLRAAEAVAAWAMRPAAVAGALPLLRCFPAVLSWGARLSGKARRVVNR